MFKQLKPKKLFLLTSLWLLLVLTVSLSFSGLFENSPRQKVEAATSSTINFQARLLSSSGNLVPDGYYNAQFKLYSASSGGTAQWTETYYDSNGVTAGNDNRVRVVNGYLSVYLGSQTALPGIDWSQEEWLTINIGGTTQTATPTWDGEMSPRLKLSAVPYAFTAGSLAKTTGGNTSTLDWDTQTAANSILLPDESGTLCIQGSSSCGFATGTAADYIQNGTSPQTADFNITGDGTVGGIFTAGAGGKTAITISDSGSQDSGITIGGDTNLYRENAGVLSTDNALNVYDGLYVEGGSGGTITLYNGNESTTQTDFTQALTKSGLNIVTDFTNGAYTPGIFWSTQDNNPTKPKAGIYLQEDGSAGTSLLFGTSDTYTTGVTNTALTLNPKGGAVFRNGSNDAIGFQVQNSTGTGLFTVNTSTGATLTSTLFIDTLGSADNNTVLCRNSSSQVATCNSSFLTGSPSDYIQNGTSLQSSSNFHISGDGKADTSFTTPLLQSAAATALLVDSGTTGALNIGTGANAKTITIGNGTGATSLVLNAGTGAINIGTNAVAHTTTIGNGTGASSVVIQSGTGAINIGTNAVAHTTTIGNSTGASSVVVNCGTGACSFGTTATAHTTTVGSTSGASTTTIQGGTGGVNLGTGGIANTIQIGNTTGAVAQTISIGTNTTASSTNTVNIGSNIGTSPVTIKSGTSGTIVQSDSTTALQIQSTSPTALFTADTTNNKKINIVGDVNIGNRFGSRLFSDNFESGNFNLWSDGTTGAISMDSTTVHDGKYATKVNVSGTGGAYAYTRLADSNTVYERAWVYIASQTGGTNAFLLNMEDNTGGTKYWMVYRDSSGVLHLTNNSTSIATGGSLPTGSWHLLEMQITIGAGTGTGKVWLDGTQVISVTGQSNGTNPIGGMWVGQGSGGSSTTWTGYIDDVVADTVATGTASSLNVDDSFHVGGSAVFGNILSVQNALGESFFTVDTNSYDNYAGGNGAIYLQSGTDLDVGDNSVITENYTTGDLQIDTYNDAITSFYTSAVRIRSSTDSATAFQVQNDNGDSVFNVNTGDLQATVTGDLNVGDRFGSRLFSDNFESGGFLFWDQTKTGDISISTTSHGGKFSALVNPASTQAYAEAAIANFDTAYLRGWVYVSSQTSANADLLTLSSSSGGYWTVYRSGGALHVYNGVASADAGSGGSFTTGAWHLIEMRVTIGSGTGTTQAWLDGTQVVNATSQSNGTNQIDTVEIGDDNGSRTFTAYIDDVVADTIPTGTASSLNVDDSLHVGGTASFGNDILINVNDNERAAIRLTETSDRGFNLFYDANPNDFVLQANDNGYLTNVMTVGRTDGAFTFHSSDDTSNTTAFQFQNASGNALFNINAQDGGVTIGSNTDFNDGRGILRLYNPDNTNGYGTKILFGDGNITSSQNAWIGEHGSTDSDQLQLQGANGVYITGEYDGSVEIANFNFDTSGGTGINAQAYVGFGETRAIFGYDGTTQDAFIQGIGGKGFKLYTDDHDSTTYSTFGVDTDGAALFRNYNDTASGFKIQNAAGQGLFNVDTSGGAVQIYGPDATGPTVAKLALTSNWDDSSGDEAQILFGEGADAGQSAGKLYYTGVNNTIHLGGLNGSGTTTDVLTFDRSGAGVILQSTNTININSTGANNITLAPAGTTNTGVVVKPSANDSTAAFSVQNQAGTSHVFDVNTTNGTVGINATAPTSQSLYVWAGTSREGIMVDQDSSSTSDLLRLQHNSSDVLSVSSAGNITAGGSSTGTTKTTEATNRDSVTSVTLTSAGFANNDVIRLVRSGTYYYTRIVSGGGTTSLTVSPAVSYDASSTVTKYNVQYLGNDGSTFTGTTRSDNSYFQGYFTGGIVTGTGSTTYSDGNINSTHDFQITAPSFKVQNSSGDSSLNLDGGSNAANVQFSTDSASIPASEGPNYCSAGAQDTSVGTTAWSTGTYSSGCANDGSIIYGTTSTAGQTSYYLKLTDFGFSIPTGATIDGITVDFEKSDTTGGADMIDSSVKIVKGGTITGTDKATTTPWPAYSGTATFTSYGGSSDTWGTTWTASDINSSNFGVALSGKQSGTGSAYFIVDTTDITVNYTTTDGNTWTQGIDTSGNFSISQTNSASGSNDVMTIGTNGNVTLQAVNDSTSTFQIQDASGTALFNVDSTNNKIQLNANTTLEWGDTTTHLAVDNVAGNDGSPVNGTDTTASTVKLGSHAGNFTGSSDYLSISDDQIDLTSDWSFETWVNLTTTSGTNPRIFGMVDSANSLNLQVGYTSSGTPYIRVNNTLYSFTPTFSTGTWQHVVYEHSGANYYLYINGTQYSVTGSSGPNANTAFSGIGAAGSSGYDITGYLDDVVLYNGALTGTEVNGRYNSGSGTENLSGSGWDVSSKTVSQWHMNESFWSASVGNYANLYSSASGALKTDSDLLIDGTITTDLTGTGTGYAVCHSGSAGTTDNVQLVDCTSAPSADYAENYPVASGIDYGDIVATGSEMVNTYDTGQDGNIDWTKVKGKVTRLIKSDEPYQTNTIGIVSDNHNDFTSAGYNIKSEDNPMPVALNGRVPVNVSSSSEPIQPGDYITTSGDSGKAMKATQAGFVIGKALESWSSDSGTTQVMVYVEQGYWAGPTSSEYLQDGGNATIASLIVTGNATLATLEVEGDADISGNLTVGGETQLAGKLDVAHGLSVSGDSTLQGNLTVSGDSTLQGNLSAGQDFSVAGKTGLNNDVTVTGKTTLQGGLKVTGTSALQQVTATSIDLTGNAAVNQLTANVATINQITSPSATITNLSVDGTATIATLHITGDSVFDGDITLNAHIITGTTDQNAQLTTEVTDAAGTDIDGNKDATCEIKGNDTAGTIILTTGTQETAAGAVCKVTFLQPFTSVPRTIISARDKDSLQIGGYVSSANSDFTLNFVNIPDSQHIYKFNYWNPQ